MSSSTKMIVLKSSHGNIFEVEASIMMQSGMIKNMIEDECAGSIIPLLNVKGKILAKIIEYCRRHVEAPRSKNQATEDEIKNFDTEFLKVDQQTLFEIILASNFLNIKSLLDLACQTVAEMIKEKTPEEIRKMFNIQNDFTPEEEEEIRQENAWAFE